MDAKEFIEHVDRVVYIRRIPAWISTEELGKQVQLQHFEQLGVFGVF